MHSCSISLRPLRRFRQTPVPTIGGGFELERPPMSCLRSILMVANVRPSTPPLFASHMIRRPAEDFVGFQFPLTI